MQILKWLFKEAQDEQETKTSTTNKTTGLTVEETKLKKLVLCKRRQLEHTEESDITYKGSNCFPVLLRGNAREVFYHSLNLKRLGGFRRRRQEEELGRMNPTGNKVFPVSASMMTNYQCSSSQKKDEVKGDNNKVISRMRELWRSNKGGSSIRRKVFHFHNRGMTKGSKQDDRLNSSSPQINFRWEADCCYNSASAYSVFSLPSSIYNSRKGIKPCSSTVDVHIVTDDNIPKDGECSPKSGNWIHTDDEYVVLEL